MPSLGDSAVIIVLGLLLFGPKGLAQIARQLGKLMGEFRRASNEFRMQMEEELRVSEQADRQKQIAAIEAAAPVPPALNEPALTFPMEEEGSNHPHLRAAPADILPDPVAEIAPVPIATSGDLSIMPPATGLPAPRSASLAPLFDSVPHVSDPHVSGSHVSAPQVEPLNGCLEAAHHVPPDASNQKPDRYTTRRGEQASSSLTPIDTIAPESVHG